MTHQIYPVSADLELVAEERILPPNDEVEALWKERPSHAFDAPCFTFFRLAKSQLIGSFVPYRYLWAQFARPSLRQRFGLVGLGVRGLVRRGNSYLLGRRSERVAKYPGLFEWAPGGVMSQLDYRQQLLDELQEETSLEGERPQPFALVWNHRAPVIDLCCTLETTGEPALSDEYTEFRWVEDPEDLPCVPTTTAIWGARP